MKITVKRSWLPWGMPDIKIDYTKEKGMIHITGAYSKSVIRSWEDMIEEGKKEWRQNNP